MDKIRKNSRKVENAWALFDWANSVYSLVISTAIFPPYFIKITHEYIPVLGQKVSNSALYAFAVTISYLVIAIITPLLSGIADAKGRRKYYLKRFTLLGALSCMVLFYFDSSSALWLGLGAFVLATIGHAGSLVFYNAYLPEIVSEERMDKVSAKGFAWGYIGSVLLLILNLWMIMKPATFGLPEGTLAIRVSFLLVGLWWFLFSQITFKYLPHNTPADSNQGNLMMKGFKQLKLVWAEVKTSADIKYFLFSFLFFSAGVQTVIFLASAFAEKVLHFETNELIFIILILQIVAIFGAYLFAWVSKRLGSKTSLIIMILIWIAICFAGYFVQSKLMFYYIAIAVGSVLGGIQSQARSAYAKLVPQDTLEMTSYFSFLDFMYKMSIILGTLAFGIIDQITGNMRYSILALAMFFVIGLLFLLPVKIRHIKQIPAR